MINTLPTNPEKDPDGAPTPDWKNFLARFNLSNTSLEGERRIIIEFADRDPAKGLELARQYAEIVAEVTGVFKSDPKCNIQEPLDVLEAVYDYLLKFKGIKWAALSEDKTSSIFDKTSLGIALEKNAWDCDTSATLIYDIAKGINKAEFEIVILPGHALLKCGEYYFESTTAELIHKSKIYRRYPQIYSRGSTSDHFLLLALDQLSIDSGEAFKKELAQNNIAFAGASANLYPESLAALCQSDDYLAIKQMAKNAVEFARKIKTPLLSFEPMEAEALASVGLNDYSRTQTILLDLICNPGRRIFHAHYLDKIDQLLSKKTTMNPSDSNPILCRALLRMLDGKFDEALINFNLIPEGAISKSAIDQFKAATRLRQTKDKLSGLSKEEETKAIATLEEDKKTLIKSINKPELAFVASVFLAEYYEMTGDRENQIKAVSSALSVKPKSYFLLEQRAALYKEAGQYEKAIRDFYGILQTKRDNQKQILTQIRDCYAKQGNTEKVSRLGIQICELDRTSLPIALDAAECAMQRNQFAKAADYLNLAGYLLEKSKATEQIKFYDSELLKICDLSVRLLDQYVDPKNKNIKIEYLTSIIDNIDKFRTIYGKEPLLAIRGRLQYNMGNFAAACKDFKSCDFSLHYSLSSEDTDCYFRSLTSQGKLERNSQNPEKAMACLLTASRLLENEVLDPQTNLKLKQELVKLHITFNKDSIGDPYRFLSDISYFYKVSSDRKAYIYAVSLCRSQRDALKVCDNALKEFPGDKFFIEEKRKQEAAGNWFANNVDDLTEALREFPKRTFLFKALIQYAETYSITVKYLEAIKQSLKFFPEGSIKHSKIKQILFNRLLEYSETHPERTGVNETKDYLDALQRFLKIFPEGSKEHAKIKETFSERLPLCLEFIYKAGLFSGNRLPDREQLLSRCIDARFNMVSSLFWRAVCRFRQNKKIECRNDLFESARYGLTGLFNLKRG